MAEKLSKYRRVYSPSIKQEGSKVKVTKLKTSINNIAITMIIIIVLATLALSTLLMYLVDVITDNYFFRSKY